LIRRTIGTLILAAATLAANACFATRNDVRTLQGDIAVLRAENARADSVHRAQAQQAASAVGAVADSLRTLNAFLVRFSTDVSRFEGDLSINMHTLGQQLLTLQELTGQNEKRLQDVRAGLERQQAELATAAQPTAPATASGAAPSAPAPAQAAAPGPAQLFELGNNMMDRGSYAAAREAFKGLLAQYPNDENAGEAEYGVARSFDLDNQPAAADSVYALVVANYPKTVHAPSALYKRAMAQKQAGQAAKAQALFQQLVDKYPSSPEAVSAADLLKKP
jgi:tol-pal system protein YbgF